MKRLVPALALLLVSALLAACGGGGSSSSTNNEEEWAAEIQSVMTQGEKSVESAEEKINAATTRKTLEAAYRTYADRLESVASKLGDDTAAITCYRRALQIDPAFVDARDNLVLACAKVAPQWHFPMMADGPRQRYLDWQRLG